LVRLLFFFFFFFFFFFSGAKYVTIQSNLVSAPEHPRFPREFLQRTVDVPHGAQQRPVASRTLAALGRAADRRWRAPASLSLIRKKKKTEIQTQTCEAINVRFHNIDRQ
jgi:hypothetical protein